MGSINVTVASPMEVAVSWAPVAWEEANGDIQFYHVILSRYEGPELNRILVNASGILQTQFSGLGKKNESQVCELFILFSINFRGFESICGEYCSTKWSSSDRRTKNSNIFH